MTDRHDPVEAAFEALRAETEDLDTARPMRTVADRRRSGRRRGVILVATAASVLLVVGVSWLVSNRDPGTVAGPPDTTVAPSTDSSAPTGDPVSLVDSSWTLLSGSGPNGEVPIVDGWPITLHFSPDTLGGTSACNGYGANYSIDDGDFTIGGLGSEDMGCDGPVMESESSYSAAFSDVDHVEVIGDELTLTGPSTELTFARNVPVPVAALVDQLWLLETLIEGEKGSPAMGDPAVLLLSQDGTVSGGTGCRSLSGEYVISGHQVQFTTFRADGDCPSLLREQDSLVVNVLGDGFTADIQGGPLVVTSRGNEVLVYRAITQAELAGTPSEPVRSDAELLEGSSWILTQGEGPNGLIGVVEGSEPRITFTTSNTLSGNLSCNDFTAGLTIEGRQLSTLLLPQRTLVCESSTMEAEAAFEAALTDVTEFALESDGQVLIMAGGETELAFNPADAD